MSAEASVAAIPTPELRVVLRCAQPHPTPAQLAELAALIRTPLDWRRVVRLAAWHRMLPLLFWHLKAAGWTGVPSSVVQELTDTFWSNAALTLQRSSALLELLGALDAAGIPALPYKGPAMAAQLYGNVALRSAGDLDIVVRRGDARRARELLFARGYAPRRPIAPGAVAFMIHSRYHETLDHPGHPTVEVHWAFTNADIDFPVAFEDLVGRAQLTPLGGRTVRVFGDEDQLLILAVHGTKHRWSRIEWLCGFAELVRRAAALDWEHALSRARALRIERRLLLGVHLAHEVLKAPVPEGIVALARQARQLPLLADEIRHELWEDAQLSSAAERQASIPQDWFQLRISDGWRERLRLVSYRATTPTQPKDWSPLRLGGVLVPLHALLRPFQVAARVVPAVWWYMTQRRVVRANIRREP